MLPRNGGQCHRTGPERRSAYSRLKRLSVYGRRMVLSEVVSDASCIESSADLTECDNLVTNSVWMLVITALPNNSFATLGLAPDSCRSRAVDQKH